MNLFILICIDQSISAILLDLLFSKKISFKNNKLGNRQKKSPSYLQPSIAGGFS